MKTVGQTGQICITMLATIAIDYFLMMFQDLWSLMHDIVLLPLYLKLFVIFSICSLTWSCLFPLVSPGRRTNPDPTAKHQNDRVDDIRANSSTVRVYSFKDGAAGSMTFTQRYYRSGQERSHPAHFLVELLLETGQTLEGAHIKSNATTAMENNSIAWISGLA